MFRYEMWLPELPKVPLVTNSSSLSSNPCGRQFNLTALHYLDSSRFIVSLSDVSNHRTTSSRDVRPPASRSRRSPRRRKTNRSNVKSRASSTTSTDAVVVDLDCFRLIFVAVDVAIVAFHLCRGYVDLQRLQRCRCRCRDAAAARIGPRALRNGGLTTSTDPVDDRSGLGRLLPPPLPSDGVVLAVCNDARSATTTNDYATLHETEPPDATSYRQQRAAGGDFLQRRRRRSYVVARTTMMLVGRLIRSRSLLPLLACAFALAATHCVIRTCSRLTAPHLTLTGGTLASVFATTVRFQTSTANAHLSEDTRHLDSVILHLSSSSMTQDLHNLLSIVYYFRQGLLVSHLLVCRNINVTLPNVEVP